MAVAHHGLDTHEVSLLIMSPNRDGKREHPPACPALPCRLFENCYCEGVMLGFGRSDRSILLIMKSD